MTNQLKPVRPWEDKTAEQEFNQGWAPDDEDGHSNNPNVQQVPYYSSPTPTAKCFKIVGPPSNEICLKPEYAVQLKTNGVDDHTEKSQGERSTLYNVDINSRSEDAALEHTFQRMPLALEAAQEVLLKSASLPRIDDFLKDDLSLSGTFITSKRK